MINLNSKNIRPGDTFICLPNGEKYIDEARKNGAAEVLCFTRAQLGIWADNQMERPSEKLKVIGVTGTNGKTTVTHLLGQALTLLGENPKVQGTLSGNLTTPESLDTHQAMADHLKEGGTHFIMEVSSHAIAQDRLSGIRFWTKALTNVTQDHLDYHLTLENYHRTKTEWLTKQDDFHINSNKQPIRPEQFLNISLPFPSPLKGQFNIENMQTTVAILRSLGYSDPQIAESLKNAKAPPGRFETLHLGQSFSVIIDYAHTPDGLEKVAKEAALLAKENNGKLRIIFGCGGDRDKTKRPLMAKVAEAHSHDIIVTSDNPRSENPNQIMTDILAGFSNSSTQIITEPDRKKAIILAINAAQKNDVILIAGKGHETYQIIGTTKHHFDDSEEAKAAISERLKLS